MKSEVIQSFVHRAKALCQRKQDSLAKLGVDGEEGHVVQCQSWTFSGVGCQKETKKNRVTKRCRGNKHLGASCLFRRSEGWGRNFEYLVNDTVLGLLVNELKSGKFWGEKKETNKEKLCM